MSNLRIIKGSGPYNATQTTLTIPTAALSAISNTQLLIFQSNRFKENSTNALTLTVNGSPSVQAFSPFAPTAAYSTANNGGSMYLDGNGDQLSINNNTAFEVGSGNFSYEAWVYALRLTNTYGQGIVSYGVAGSTGSSVNTLQINNNGYLQLSYATGAAPTITDSGLFPINQWVHVVGCRTGSTLSLYRNGSRVATTTTSDTVGTGGAMTIGGQWYANETQRQLQGYLSDARVLKGSSAYDATQSTITIPTAPLTNIANTSLLCNFTNAQIFDQTTKLNFECVGTAKVSTSVYKYGTGSIDLNSNSNDSYLITDTTRNIEFGTGDFTIEGWVYPFSTTTSSYCDGNATIFDTDSSAGTGTDWWVFHQVAAGFTFGTNGTVVAQSGSGLTANQWSHFAITRSGSTIRIFTNGTLSNTATYSTTTGGNRRLYIGKQPGQNRFFKGYLDDLRITKGYARYTAGFTAPTSAFQNR